MADPTALLVAVAAAHARRVRRPARGAAQPGPGRRPPGDRAEEQPQCTRHLGGPRATCGRYGRRGAGPPARRHYQAARSLGHGDGYEYPHDDPRGWVPQQYRPTTSRSAVLRAVGTASSRRSAKRMEERSVTAGDFALVVATVLCTIGFAGLVVALVYVLACARRAAPGRRPVIHPNGAAPRRPGSIRSRKRAAISNGSTACSAPRKRSAHRSRARSRRRQAALSEPVIKTVAIASGTKRAARRLSRRERTRRC